MASNKGAAAVKKKAAPPAAKKAAKKTTKNAPPPAANAVLAWEDDPASTTSPAPIQRPVPNLGEARLGIKIDGTQPPPKVYARGTAEFRFWVAAEALRRAADFWAAIVP